MSQIENQQRLHSATQIIVRDFDIDEEEANLQPQHDIDIHHLEQVLSAEISKLIDHDLEKLKWLLYRIDVDEAKLHKLLASTPPPEAPGAIARKIIERQLEKAKTREQYRKGEL